VFPIDISKIPDRWAKEILAHCLSGGVLLVGMCLTHFDRTEQFLRYSELNGIAKSALGIFVAYVLGFLLLSIGGALLMLVYFLGYGFGSIIRRRAAPTIENSNNRVWRRIASFYLPSQFVQLEEPSISAEEFRRKLKTLVEQEGTKDPDALREMLLKAGAVEFHRQHVDQEWKYLYSALQCYFYKPPVEDLWYGLGSLYGMSLASGVMAVFSPVVPGVLWSVCAVLAAIAVIVTVVCGSATAYSQPFEAIAAANILKEWHLTKSKPE